MLKKKKKSLTSAFPKSIAKAQLFLSYKITLEPIVFLPIEKAYF